MDEAARNGDWLAQGARLTARHQHRCGSKPARRATTVHAAVPSNTRCPAQSRLRPTWNRIQGAPAALLTRIARNGAHLQRKPPANAHPRTTAATNNIRGDLAATQGYWSSCLPLCLPCTDMTHNSYCHSRQPVSTAVAQPLYKPPTASTRN